MSVFVEEKKINNKTVITNKRYKSLYGMYWHSDKQ